MLLVSVVLGYLGGRYGWLPGGTDDESDGALSWVGFALVVLGLGIETWGFVRNWRSGAGVAAWNSPILSLSRRRRRELRDQVRGRVPLDPGSTALTREFAVAVLRDYRRLMPIIVGVGVIALGQVLQHSGLLRVFSLVGVLFLVWGVLVMRRDTKSARAFLAAYN